MASKTGKVSKKPASTTKKAAKAAPVKSKVSKSTTVKSKARAKPAAKKKPLAAKGAATKGTKKPANKAISATARKKPSPAAPQAKAPAKARAKAPAAAPAPKSSVKASPAAKTASPAIKKAPEEKAKHKNVIELHKHPVALGAAAAASQANAKKSAPTGAEKTHAGSKSKPEKVPDKKLLALTKQHALNKKNVKTKSLVETFPMDTGNSAIQPSIASTIGIMGIEPYRATSNEEYMNTPQKEHFRKILMLWKQSLMEEVDRIVDHMQDEAANFPDPNDRATQEEEFGLALRARDRERKLIKKIDEALASLQDDEYGYCETCGIEIGIRRLEARPTATLCIDCKTLEEIRERQNRS